MPAIPGSGTIQCRRLVSRLACLCLAAIFPGTGLALDLVVVPPGELLAVRLTAPVSTYRAKKGDPISFVLASPLYQHGLMVLPAGVRVNGSVDLVRKVGLGFRHTAAALRIAFHEVQVS